MRKFNKHISFRTFQSQLSDNITYQKTVLDNGIIVLSEYIPHVRSVSLGFWINVGSRYENRENNGITHFIEHITFKGTKKRTANEIAQSIEQVGGYFNAFTSKEHTCFYARVLDEYTPLAFDVLADLILNAKIDKNDVEKEKYVVIEEIKQTEDDPNDFIHEYFEQVLFKGHPFELPILGTIATVSSFTPKQLKEYYKENYTVPSIIVAVAGNVTHSSIIKLCEQYFGKLVYTHNMKKEPYSNPVTISKQQYVIEKPIHQAHISLGTLAFAATDPNRYKLQVLNTLLGEGMSSRLFQNIREKYGFAYSVYSFYSPMSDIGSFGAYIATDNKHIDRCIDLIWKEFIAIKKGKVSNDDIQRTKAQLKGNLFLGLESIPNRMIRLASNELYFGKIVSLEEVINSLDKVTRDDVISIAEQLFDDNKFLTVILKPQHS